MARQPVKIILSASVAVVASATAGQTPLPTAAEPLDTRQKWEAIEAAFRAGNLSANVQPGKRASSTVLAQFRNIASPWGDNSVKKPPK